MYIICKYNKSLYVFINKQYVYINNICKVVYTKILTDNLVSLQLL